MFVYILRALFVLLMLAVAMRLVADDAANAIGIDFVSNHKVWVVIGFVALGLLIVGIDILVPRKSLAAISGVFFGLLVGMVMSYGLSLVVDLLVEAIFPQYRFSPTVAQLGSGLDDEQSLNFQSAAKKILGDYTKDQYEHRPAGSQLGTGDSGVSVIAIQETVDKLEKLIRPNMVAASENVGHPLISAAKLTLGVISCFLTISFVLQTKDDIRFVIPYVEFARQTKGSKPLILDTSVIVDGRVADLAETGIFETEMIVPRFVLLELQGIADSQDRMKRSRGRRGLDLLKTMQHSEKADIRIMEAAVEKTGGVDAALVELTTKLDGRLMTNDLNLCKVADLRGVPVININELTNALKPPVLPGEVIEVRIVKPGEEAGQGIGYLEDGTMVVVAGASDNIGELLPVTVTRVLQLPAGRMIFGRTDDAPDERRRPRTFRSGGRGGYS
jgi:uncharacterized protein YacL